MDNQQIESTKMKKLTNKEIDQYCRTVIYHLIDAYDTDAFCESDISLEDQYKIIARMKYYANKYITNHIEFCHTNKILDSVIKDKK